MKTITTVIISFLMLSYGCYKPIDKSKVLTKHLKSLLQDDYKENANYIIVNKSGCLGCISKNILFLKNNPHYLRNYNSLITSKSIIEVFPEIMDIQIMKYIDTSDVLEKLNTGVTGFSAVTIKENIVTKLLNSNVLISSDNLKLDTFFKTEQTNNFHNSTFVELFRNEFEQKFPTKGLDSIKLNRTTLIFFTSDHCAPCKIMFPIIDSLSMIYSDSVDFFFIKANKKDNMKLFYEYAIRATPTLVIYRKAHPIKQKIGLLDKKEIIKLLFKE